MIKRLFFIRSLTRRAVAYLLLRFAGCKLAAGTLWRCVHKVFPILDELAKSSQENFFFLVAVSPPGANYYHLSVYHNYQVLTALSALSNVTLPDSDRMLVQILYVQTHVMHSSVLIETAT